MGGSISQNIKKEIVLNLNALVQAGVINSVIELDTGKDPLTIEPQAGYPFALVGMPVVTADYEDQATNRRTYRFDVLIATSYENLADQNEGVESILDAVLNQFDNNFTLAGAAIATVLPRRSAYNSGIHSYEISHLFYANIEGTDPLSVEQPNTMSLGQPQANKMMSPPAKKEFHFASDGIHYAQVVYAETIQEAEEMYHRAKRLISPPAEQSTVAPTKAEDEDVV